MCLEHISTREANTELMHVQHPTVNNTDIVATNFAQLQSHYTIQCTVAIVLHSDKRQYEQRL